MDATWNAYRFNKKITSVPGPCIHTTTHTPSPPPLHVQHDVGGERSATETTAKSETYSPIQELAQNN